MNGYFGLRSNFGFASWSVIFVPPHPDVSALRENVDRISDKNREGEKNAVDGIGIRVHEYAGPNESGPA